MKVLISTSSFGVYDKAPLELLEKKGYEIVLNPHKRKLNSGELIELARECEGVVAGTEAYTMEIFQGLPKLKVISRCGAGIDGIDLDAVKKNQIKLRNTPDGPTDAVAELALSLILCSLRKINCADRKIREGTWKKEMGNLLLGKVVGIIGTGRIGRRLAQLLQPFKVMIIANDLTPDTKWAQENGVRIASLDEVLQQSDIVTLHIPYSDANRHLIDSKRIDLMKKNAILINTSRGGLVDEMALYDALKNGRLKGAALDVMEKEPYDGLLKELENTVLTPHIGSYAIEARIKMEMQAVENLIEALEG